MLGPPFFCGQIAERSATRLKATLPSSAWQQGVGHGQILRGTRGAIGALRLTA